MTILFLNTTLKEVPGFMSTFRFRVLTESGNYDTENTAVLTNTKYAAFDNKKRRKQNQKAAHKALAIVVLYIAYIYSAPLKHHCYASHFFSGRVTVIRNNHGEAVIEQPCFV